MNPIKAFCRIFRRRTFVKYGMPSEVFDSKFGDLKFNEVGQVFYFDSHFKIKVLESEKAGLLPYVFVQGQQIVLTPTQGLPKTTAVGNPYFFVASMPHVIDESFYVDSKTMTDVGLALCPSNFAKNNFSSFQAFVLDLTLFSQKELTLNG